MRESGCCDRDFRVLPPNRHSREGGLRFTSAEPNIQRLQRHPSRSSFPRRRESSDFRRSRTKGPGFPRSRERRQVRVRESGCCDRDFSVLPPNRHSRERGLRFTSAEPNIQRLQALSHERPWIPAFAGMTAGKSA
ncbi:hypothetical protein [Lysobacter gummosus]|uniref:hypothetical protein n=1 Tax=Lysobacter gummosus TaxID=262324 RepID=UPI0036397B8A